MGRDFDIANQEPNKAKSGKRRIEVTMLHVEHEEGSAMAQQSRQPPQTPTGESLSTLSSADVRQKLPLRGYATSGVRGRCIGFTRCARSTRRITPRLYKGQRSSLKRASPNTRALDLGWTSKQTHTVVGRQDSHRILPSPTAAGDKRKYPVGQKGCCTSQQSPDQFATTNVG